ncbi:MAG: alpha/beta hydrolase fold domain-containing protein, partial [Acidimicrobiales bacterium]
MSPQPPGRPPGPTVHRVADVQLRGPTGPLAARAYWPPPREPVNPPALLVLLPGDGSGAGGLDRADALCRGVCAQVGVVVLSVPGRSAIPGPRPIALEDSTAAVRWAADHAPELGADRRRLLVAGTGIGGELAAAVARQAGDDGWPVIECQVSIERGTAE